MAFTQKFRLKHGAHVTGVMGDSNNPEKRFFANDPLHNVVESEEDLADQEPTRWERMSNVGSYSDADMARMREAQSTLSLKAKRDHVRQLAEMQEALQRQIDEEDAAAEKHQLAVSTQAPPQVGQQSPSSSSPAGASGQPGTPASGEGSLPPNIDNLSTNDLRTLAAERKIDLKGATKREDILRHVKDSGKKG